MGVFFVILLIPSMNHFIVKEKERSNMSLSGSNLQQRGIFIPSNATPIEKYIGDADIVF